MMILSSKSANIQSYNNNTNTKTKEIEKVASRLLRQLHNYKGCDVKQKILDAPSECCHVLSKCFILSLASTGRKKNYEHLNKLSI